MDGAALTDAARAFLDRPLSPVAPAVAAAIDAGPIVPGDTLGRDDLDRLCDPAPLPAETGWCTLPDGVGYVAVRTEMPAVDPGLIEWWFDWHPRESVRYRIWHPRAHRSNRLEPSRERAGKRWWGTTHHPVEDIGLGLVHARIEFRAPTELGFAVDHDERIGAIVAGWAGDDRRRLRHTLMAHVFLRAGDGLLLRSRFWLGSAIRPYAPDGPANAAAALLNRRAVRRLAVPAAAPRALARHCAEEFANLATLLPELRDAGIAPAAR